MINSKALVLFSGGQDSTTCLYWAKNKFESVEALNLYYGQRHILEIESAKKIAEKANVPLITHEISILKEIADSALLNNINDINESHRGSNNLPSSFVPGRNIFFLTVAGAIAFKKEIKHIVTGVCETDYSGYPDCRDNTIKSTQVSLSLAINYDFEIHTPLMNLSKSDSITLAMYLPGCLDALAYSHTCYEGKFPPCGKCPACVLREKGFKESGINDPLIERSKNG
jgi:7-cyano-7-deazaguanine synthase